jgi:excisionase family DNA binding protein
MTKQEIEELLSRPTITPDELLQSKILRVGRNSIYEAISSGEIAAMKVGKKKLILTAPLRKQLGI